MDYGEKSRSLFVPTVFGLTLLLNAAAPVVAQDVAKPTVEPIATKWRPHAGPYASVGTTFDEKCLDFGEIVIDLAKKYVGGSEVNCKINRLADTAPGAIKLDMTCIDETEKPRQEIMLLKKVDDKTFFMHGTQNGKFMQPGERFSYCPEKVQLSYRDAQRREREEQKAKAAEKKAKLKMEKWHPKDGVYASPGADFNDRCLQSGAVVIVLAENSVSSGKTECKIFQLIDEPPGTVYLDMICSQTPGQQTVDVKQINGQTIYETPGTENITLKRIDDKTFFLQGVQNSKLAQPVGPVSYCPEDTQRMYRDQNAKK